MTYGDGGTTFSPLTSLDVAGGLNEATSDVFGTMVEFKAANANDAGDYYIGEKISKNGTYLRRMDNPSADGASVNCWSTATGSLDPHYSSGVGNHLFYLLAEGTGTKTMGGRTHTGTSCNASTLTGIGGDATAAQRQPARQPRLRIRCGVVELHRWRDHERRGRHAANRFVLRLA